MIVRKDGIKLRSSLPSKRALLGVLTTEHEADKWLDSGCVLAT